MAPSRLVSRVIARSLCHRSSPFSLYRTTRFDRSQENTIEEREKEKLGQGRTPDPT